MISCSNVDFKVSILPFVNNNAYNCYIFVYFKEFLLILQTEKPCPITFQTTPGFYWTVLRMMK